MSYAIKMIKVEYNNAVHDFPEGISVGDVIKKIHGRKSNAIAALVDKRQKDLSYSLKKNCKMLYFNPV